MNLINGLNEKKYTLQGLSEHYYEKITNLVKEINEKGKNDEDTFKTYVNAESPLRDISYDEFLEMTKLLKQYEGANANRISKFGAVINDKKPIENELKKITNFSLIRRLSQDMEKEDTKSVLKENFFALEKLGYKGEEDEKIPESVRGIFNMNMRNVERAYKVRAFKEVIDRMRLFPLKVGYKSSHKVGKYAIDRVLTLENPIGKIRSELKERGAKPFELDRNEIIEEYYKEQCERLLKNVDLENEKEKIQDGILKNQKDANEKTYDRLSSLGYDGSKGHPLVRAGYQTYFEGYLHNKELEHCLDYAGNLSFSMCSGYPDVELWALEQNYAEPVGNIIKNLVAYKLDCLDRLRRAEKVKGLQQEASKSVNMSIGVIVNKIKKQERDAQLRKEKSI